MHNKHIWQGITLSIIITIAGISGTPEQSQQIGTVDELVVCLMADPQLVMVSKTPRYVDMAMNDLKQLDHDFIAVLGDLVQNRADFYKDYKEKVLDRSDKPVYSLAGNGDVGAGLSAYQEATGLPLYYTMYKKGIRFIFLCTVSFSGKHNHICHLGPKQLAWLERELAADALATTIIFSHPPIFETTWHSEERDHFDFPGSMYLSKSAQMRKLFDEYPNIKVYAHGHLHHTYGLMDEYGRDDYHKEGNVLHISVERPPTTKAAIFCTSTQITAP